MSQVYSPELYLNRNTPLYAVDAKPILTLEERERRWEERRWLAETEVVADDWLFAPLPSCGFDEL